MTMPKEWTDKIKAQQSGKSNEFPKGNDNNRIDVLKKQYDKLTEDWRYFNNLIWGVPTVAIAIMTGILIGAYHNLHDGSWERIASLSIGSFFLLALTIEVIKKRYHMNVLSSLLKDLQVELGLEKFQFPLGISEDIDKYLDKKRMTEKFADYNHDPLFNFFKISYARKYLTYVIFSAAIILAILAEWEFIKYQMIGRWTLGTGVTVGILAIAIPVVWYAVVWYGKGKTAGCNDGYNGNDRSYGTHTTNSLEDIAYRKAYDRAYDDGRGKKQSTHRSPVHLPHV